MSELDGVADRIERSIDINAPAEKVWELLRQPGWWINDGDIVPRTTSRDEGTHVVEHPEQGTFRLSTVRSDPPRYLSYRWHDAAAEDATLVEFFVEAKAEGVTLRVVESGIRSLSRPPAAVERYFGEHTVGWEIEPQAADRYLVAS